jgi:cyclophilin family peptidyl-prolyl cis-trans isomerase
MNAVRRPCAAILVLVLAACRAAPAASVDLATCPTSAPSAAQAGTILADASRVGVSTSLGSFTIELDARSAPIATANFVALARCGFYEGITFHRVLAGFVAQAGDPQTRTNREPFEGLGSGGPGYKFEVEFPTLDQPYDRYTVAMANAMQYDLVSGEITGGTDTNGSQFFIDLVSLVGSLRPYYSVIGKVVDGTDVIDTIGAVETNGVQAPPIPSDVPLEAVIIEAVTVEAGA